MTKFNVNAFWANPIAGWCNSQTDTTQVIPMMTLTSVGKFALDHYSFRFNAARTARTPFGAVLQTEGLGITKSQSFDVPLHFFSKIMNGFLVQKWKAPEQTVHRHAGEDATVTAIFLPRRVLLRDNGESVT